MTTEANRIQEQLQRAFAGRAWHGPAILELLADVDAAKAAARPIAGAHSIWELVLHIAAWNKAGVRRLNGDRADLGDEENFPPVVDTSEEAWRQTIESLKRAHRELHYAIQGLDDARLDQPIISGMSSVYGTLHGIIQHGLYHAGQIALLKKA
ncbi:MAG TPA: DinB family protein [Pyrinomonadaceae bacterium]|nr:DinB family protein [Pyrinomonadaceae bacterium]